MADAERPNPVLPLLLAWLVPGGGHLWLRRPWPALFVATAVLALYAAGMALAHFANVSPERHPYYFAIHSLAAGPTALAALLTQGVQVLEHRPHRSVGELYTAVACLLNLVAVADVWARCRRGDPVARGSGQPQGATVRDGATPEEPEPEGPRSLVAPERPEGPARG
jgi:hypothetical protein